MTEAALDPVSQENVTRTELQHKKKKLDFDILNQFKGREGLFLKAFFVDATLNENGWRVTDQAIVRDIHTAMQSDYFGRTAPLIMRADFGHPPDDSPDIVAAQEPDRVGDFLAVGIDDKTGHAYFIAEVTEPRAIKAVQDGDVNFLSPSLRAVNEFHRANGEIVVTQFRVNHAALVKEPAFGKDKAQIRGRCAGTPEVCLTQLSTISARSYQAAPRIIFNTQGDSKVDARICLALDGAVFNSGNQNRILIPDDTHPNCRCFWTLQSTGENLGQDPIDKTLQSALAKQGLTCVKNDKGENVCVPDSIMPEESIPVEAQVNTCSRTGNLIIELQAETALQKCVSSILSEKGGKPSDQDIAIAFSECRKKSGETESLKTNESNEKSLTEHAPTEEEKKEELAKKARTAQEVEEKKVEEEKIARRATEHENNKDKDSDDKIDNLEKEVEALKASINAEVKGPLVAKIMEARQKLGQEEDDKEKDEKEASLMAKSTTELRAMVADYDLMASKIKEANVNATTDIKYNFQASEENDPDGVKSMHASIQGRMA